MAEKKRYILKRVATTVVLLLVATLTGAYIWLNKTHTVKTVVLGTPSRNGTRPVKNVVYHQEPNYTTLLKKYIPDFLSDATNHLYKISFSDIKIDLLKKTIQLQGVQLQSDPAIAKQLALSHHEPLYLINLTIPAINMTGVAFADLLANRSLNCDELNVVRPKAEIEIHPAQNGRIELPAFSGGGGAGMEKLFIGHMKISKPDITIRQFGYEHTVCHINGGEATLNSWTINKDAGKDTSSFFYAKSGAVQLGTISISKPGQHFTVRSASLQFSSKNHDVLVRNIVVSPIERNDANNKRLGVYKEVYTVRVPQVWIKNIDRQKLLRNNILQASSMTLDAPYISVYLNRDPPPDSQNFVGIFPQQLLRKAEFKLNLNKTFVRNATVVYTEHSTATKRDGVLKLTGLNGTISNITNIPELVKRNPHCIVTAKGKFAGSPANARWDILLSDPHGHFNFNGHISDISAPQISKALEAFSLVGIESLNLHRLDLSVSANDQSSNGRLTMLYDSLKVQIKRMEDNGSLSNKHLKTMMTNHVFLFPANPMPGDVVRSYTTSISRNRMRSFFGLVWSNLREGVDKTVIKDQKLAENVARSNDPRKPKKGAVKGFFKSVFRKKAKQPDNK